jgi:hypothetical protein
MTPIAVREEKLELLPTANHDRYVHSCFPQATQ